MMIVSDSTQHEQANVVNLAFLEPLEAYRLTTPLTRLTLEESPEFLQVSEMRVQKVTAKLQSVSKLIGTPTVCA